MTIAGDWNEIGLEKKSHTVGVVEDVSVLSQIFEYSE